VAYQVIIVGAGPAGGSLGYFLAKEGVNVLILEKKNLPRRKTCAGGIPSYIDQLLGFPIDEVVEQKVKELLLSYRGKDRITFSSHREVMYTVMRDRFDYFLKTKAEDEGGKNPR
jgi:flavin-dependent dehydrogenase